MLCLRWFSHRCLPLAPFLTYFVYHPSFLSLNAPKASAEGACIICKMGYCYRVWLVTVVVVCVVTVVLLIWLLLEVWLVTVVRVVSNDGALPCS